jgi:hypothetical protein
LPDGFLLWCLARDTDARAASVWARRVLLDLAKLDTLWRDIMAGISKVEHAPEGSVGVGFGDLEERKIRRIWRGQ